MVITLLADANIEGHVAALVARMQTEPWREFWEHLGLRCLAFSDIGLDAADSDLAIWQRCQQHGIFLLTDNRNNKGPDSLESVIRSCGSGESLPVLQLRIRGGCWQASNMLTT